ncbi:MAG: MotA/TolQ/ExbB proton channel family protein [Desulforegulaceae bacterium]|nr:MotA/TolQ/ExbB proton channel family protein [Desulforegulaceae bacterium]
MELLLNPLQNYIEKGGFVLIPILITSVFMWTFIFERILWFKKACKNDISVNEISEILSGSKTCPAKKGLNAFLVKKYLNKKTGIRKKDIKIIDQSLMEVQKNLNSYIAAISILAAVSPLFGLLGTVTGMISTFDVISFFGTGNPKAMASGISQALITTQTGLLTAIPGMFMAVIISGKAKRAKDSLNEAAMIIKRSIK